MEVLEIEFWKALNPEYFILGWFLVMFFTWVFAGGDERK